MGAWILCRRFCSAFLDTFLPDLVLPLPCLAGPLKGMVMEISLKDERHFLYGNFESDVIKTIVNVVKPGNIVYDVGAHVGYHTLLFSRLVGLKGHCIAFEPSDKVFQRLGSNIQRNRRRLQARVDTMDVALYSETGHKEFFTGGSTSTGRLVRFPKEGARGRIITVPVTTIDRLVANGAPLPDIIKIDVEYTEDHVIRGALDTIGGHQVIILCEIHAKDTGINCFNLLRSASYKIRHMETGHLWDSPDSVSIGHIIAFPAGSQNKC